MNYDDMSDEELRALAQEYKRGAYAEEAEVVHEYLLNRNIRKQIEEYYADDDKKANDGVIWWVLAAALALVAAGVQFANTIHTTYEIIPSPDVQISQPKQGNNQ